MRTQLEEMPLEGPKGALWEWEWQLSASSVLKKNYVAWVRCRNVQPSPRHVWLGAARPWVGTPSLRPHSPSHPTPAPNSAKLGTRLPGVGGGARTFIPLDATTSQHAASTKRGPLRPAGR